MDNKDIEVLDDFGFEDNDQVIQNNIDNQEVTPMKPVTSEKNVSEDNPVVEIINNKTTIRLIIIMLVILFVAVFFMPKIFELINNR